MKLGINLPAFLQSAGNVENAIRPFYITSIEDGNEISFSVETTMIGRFHENLEYSRDGIVWNSVDPESVITLNSLESIYFRNVTGQNYTPVFIDDGYGNDIGLKVFVSTKQYNVGGDIVKLFYSSIVEKGFDSAFDDGLVVSAENLNLGNEVANRCFSKMFENCHHLTNAPKLPAQELAPFCYFEMFYGCDKLVESPILPAKTLSEDCYRNMFYSCSSMNKITCLAVNNIEDATMYWVEGVSSNGEFIKSPEATWNTATYENLFKGIPKNWIIK